MVLWSWRIMLTGRTCFLRKLRGTIVNIILPPRVSFYCREFHFTAASFIFTAASLIILPHGLFYWTNAGILLIGHLGTHFSEILFEIYMFSFKKVHLKTSSAKWRPFCLGLNVLINWTLCKISSLCERSYCTTFQTSGLGSVYIWWRISF